MPLLKRNRVPRQQVLLLHEARPALGQHVALAAVPVTIPAGDKTGYEVG